MTTEKKELSAEEKMVAFLDKDLPAFLRRMEKKYTKEFMAEHLSLLVLMQEGNKSDRFIPRFNGTTKAIYRTAHAAIRLVAQEMNKNIPELERCKMIMNSIWLALEKDIGSEGIPDSIYAAFMNTEQEQPPTPPSSDQPTMEEPT